jgi:hypothetical protein
MNFKICLAAVFLALLPCSFAMAESTGEKCELVQCQGSNCGCTLKKKGWKEIARCSGHQWRYLIERKGERRICQGINARGGPSEKDCMKFDGDLTEFKLCKESKSK